MRAAIIRRANKSGSTKKKEKHLINVREFVPIDLIRKQIASGKKHD